MCGFDSLFVHRDHITVELVFDCNRGSLGGESDIETFLMCWTKKEDFIVLDPAVHELVPS